MKLTFNNRPQSALWWEVLNLVGIAAALLVDMIGLLVFSVLDLIAGFLVYVKIIAKYAFSPKRTSYLDRIQ